MTDTRAPAKPPTPAEVAARFRALTGMPMDGGYLALTYAILGVDPPNDSRGLDPSDADAPAPGAGFDFDLPAR